MGWFALPFEFPASPSIFATCADATQRTRHSMELGNGPWSVCGPFRSDVFVADAISVESDIRDILFEVLGGWERRLRSLFDPESINDVKTELEGAWSTRGLVLCCDVDTAGETIVAPPPKIEGARAFAPTEDFVVGSQHIGHTALQSLRGYMNHWLVDSTLWTRCAHPLGLLMS